MEGLTQASATARRVPRTRVHRALHLPLVIHRSVVAAIAHDAPNVAQSAAYSSIVALFPTLIVAAAIIGYLPDTAPIHAALQSFFGRIFPPEIETIIAGYFVSTTSTTTRSVLLAFALTVSGASSVIVTFMEGLRRARNLPPDCWTFWQRRGRSLLLVPLSLVPLLAASILVVFGHFLTSWIVLHVPSEVRGPVYIVAVAIRWIVSLAASVGLIALLYSMGTPQRQHWRRALPGAVVATFMWFFATLGFGWYVTRFANYSKVYGSLGAGIALLIWLYLVSFSVLCGAEFNAQVDPIPAISCVPDNLSKPRVDPPG